VDGATKRNDYDYDQDIMIPKELIQFDEERSRNAERLKQSEEKIEELQSEKVRLEGQLAEAYSTIKQKTPTLASSPKDSSRLERGSSRSRVKRVRETPTKTNPEKFTIERGSPKLPELQGSPDC
jgi:septal ring factor EnvC (AmiA/AmiB activator)